MTTQEGSVGSVMAGALYLRERKEDNASISLTPPFQGELVSRRKLLSIIQLFLYNLSHDGIATFISVRAREMAHLPYWHLASNRPCTLERLSNCWIGVSKSRQRLTVSRYWTTKSKSPVLERTGYDETHWS